MAKRKVETSFMLWSISIQTGLTNGENKQKGGDLMEKLNFYDLRAKKKFTTDKYKIVVKKGRRFAVAKAPSGVLSYRIVGKA